MGMIYDKPMMPTSGHSSWSTSSVRIQLGDDGVAHTLHLLLLLVELLNLDKLVGVQPLDGLIALVDDSLLVVFADLVLELVVIESGPHIEAVALKSLLSRNPLLLLPLGKRANRQVRLQTSSFQHFPATRAFGLVAAQLNLKLQHFPVRQLAGPDRSGNFPDRTDPATSQHHAIVSNAIILQH